MQQRELKRQAYITNQKVRETLKNVPQILAA